MSIEHSPLGASGAHCWLLCPGSVNAQKSLIDPGSEFALEGSAAHELAELCLSTGNSTTVYLGATLPTTKVNVTKEMAVNVQEYVDYISAIGGFQEYEQKVSYEQWVPGGFGTADAIIIKGDDLFVVDLKYGKGVKVDAEDNPQGKLYALGALWEREAFQDFKTVTIIIHQPRLNHVSEWKTSPEALYAWAEEVRERAQLCLSPGAPRVPGDKQCRFCKAKPTCPELMKFAEDTIMQKFDDLDKDTLTTIDELTDDQISNILSKKDLIINWLGSIETYIKDKIESGQPIPGWKMVHGRSNRKWADDLEAEKVLRSLLGEDAYTKKLLSAAAAEKALGKEERSLIKELIVKPDGAPVLVPESDPRPAIERITADNF